MRLCCLFRNASQGYDICIMLTDKPFTTTEPGGYGGIFPKLPKSAQWQSSDTEDAQLQVAGEATSPSHKCDRSA